MIVLKSPELKQNFLQTCNNLLIQRYYLVTCICCENQEKLEEIEKVGRYYSRYWKRFVLISFSSSADLIFKKMPFE